MIVLRARVIRLSLPIVSSVKQDSVPRLDLPAAAVGRRLLFGYNPGPLNKSWGFNVAARQTSRPILVLADADVLVGDSLEQAIELCRTGADAVKPYCRIVDLIPEESRRVRSGDWSLEPQPCPETPPNREAQDEYVCSPGRLRHDARFVSAAWRLRREVPWLGGEDDATTIKLARARMRVAECGERPALHLWHPRTPEATHGQAHYAANRQLAADYRAYADDAFARLCEVPRQTIGNPHKYSPER